VFEGLKARLDRLFADAPVDRRAAEGDLREALIEAKVGLGVMREALAKTDAELAGERRQQADAERRGALAAEIGDTETVEIAARFAARHAERAEVLQRKVEVQREELRLAEREAAEIAAMFRARGAAQAGDSVRAAWRDLEAAGGTRPETDLDGVLQKAEQDRRLRDEAVDAQLARLKKKFGKD
jgi:hypothetical protein